MPVSDVSSPLPALGMMQTIVSYLGDSPLCFDSLRVAPSAQQKRKLVLQNLPGTSCRKSVAISVWTCRKWVVPLCCILRLTSKRVLFRNSAIIPPILLHSLCYGRMFLSAFDMRFLGTNSGRCCCRASVLRNQDGGGFDRREPKSMESSRDGSWSRP